MNAVNTEPIIEETTTMKSRVGETPVAHDEDYWRGVRREFPALKRHTYLRSAATGPLAPGVAEAVAKFYREVAEDGDCAWERWVAQREEARAAIAQMINAYPDEIAFVPNTSTGMNLIVDACEERGAVVSCAHEFPTSTLPWLHRRVEVCLLPERADRAVQPEQIERAMSKRTGIICLSHVQFSTGQRLDIEGIGQRKGDHLFVVNASQSAGVLGIDVRQANVDALCATGHKWLLAGFGTGFVFMRRELLAETRPRVMSWMSQPEPFAFHNMDVTMRADMAARAEIGTPAFNSIFALDASCAYLERIGFREIESRALETNRLLTNRLSEEGWRVLSPLADERMRSAETLVEVAEPARVASKLAARGILVTQKPEGLRIATHFFNDADDIERFIAELNELRN